MYLLRGLVLYLTGTISWWNWLLACTANSFRVSASVICAPSLFHSRVSISVSSQWSPFVSSPFHTCIFLFFSIGKRSFLQLVIHNGVKLHFDSAKCQHKASSSNVTGWNMFLWKYQEFGVLVRPSLECDNSRKKRPSVVILGILNVAQLHVSAQNNFQFLAAFNTAMGQGNPWTKSLENKCFFPGNAMCFYHVLGSVLSSRCLQP